MHRHSLTQRPTALFTVMKRNIRLRIHPPSLSTTAADSVACSSENSFRWYQTPPEAQGENALCERQKRCLANTAVIVNAERECRA